MGRDAQGRGPGMAPGAVGMRGAGLIEALIALGLLAGSTLGTLAAFTGAERGGHAAWLRLTAVDLAADAAEQLRATSPTSAWDATAWQARVATLLPDGVGSLAADAQGYRLTLRWRDRATGTPQQLMQHIALDPAP